MAWSVPAAEAQLVTALQARTNLADTLIQEGLPVKIPKESERVYLLGTEDAERTYTGSQQRQAESFTMPVLIEVRGYGNTSTTRTSTKERAWEIVEELEAALADDPSLDANVHTAETGKAVAPAPRPTEDGWLMHITVDVNCVSLLA